MEVKRQKNGELTTPEIRKLIRAHNILSAIKIPKGAKRKDIIDLLKNKGYMIDHEKAEMRPVSKGKVQKMKIINQKKVKEVLPKTKTKLEKLKAKEAKEEKLIEKKKEERKKKKEIISKAIQQDRKKMDRKKSFKQLPSKNNKEEKKKMPPKITQEQLKSIKVIKTKKEKEEEKKNKEKDDAAKKSKTFNFLDQTFKFLDKDFTYESLIDWIDNEGFKITKMQKGNIENLIDRWKLSKMRYYYKSNGELVLVPTIRFEGINAKTKESLGLVDSEMTGDRGIILKTELKPKVKKNYSPEERKEFDKSRFLFFWNEERKIVNEKEPLRKKIESKDVKYGTEKYEKLSKQINDLEKKRRSAERNWEKILKDYNLDKYDLWNKKVKPEEIFDKTTNTKKEKSTEKKELVKFKVGDLIIERKIKKFPKFAPYFYVVEVAFPYLDKYEVRMYNFDEEKNIYRKDFKTEDIKVRNTTAGASWKLASELPNYKDVVSSNWKNFIKEK